MEKPHSYLTANNSPAKAVGLLDLNEQLHALSPRLKERRPEDVARALSLVTDYGKLVADENREVKVDNEFKRLQSLLPEAVLLRYNLVVGGKTREQLFREMDEKFIEIMDDAKKILQNESFDNSDSPRNITLVRIKLQDLNIEEGSTENILNKARELGLDICPPEIAPYYRLMFDDQLENETVCLGMEEVSLSGKKQVYTLSLQKVDGRLRLGVMKGLINEHWRQSVNFVFCLRV